MDLSNSICKRMIYGLEPKEVSGDEQQFVLADKKSAFTVSNALKAKTWDAFVKTTGYSWEEFLNYDHEDLKLYFKNTPDRNDQFSLSDYWGAVPMFDYIVIDPRQVAYDLVESNPKIRNILQLTGFEFHPAFPGFRGVEMITFQDERLVQKVPTYLVLEKNQELLYSCFPL